MARPAGLTAPCGSPSPGEGRRPAWNLPRCGRLPLRVEVDSVGAQQKAFAGAKAVARPAGLTAPCGSPSPGEGRRPAWNLPRCGRLPLRVEVDSVGAQQKAFAGAKAVARPAGFEPATTGFEVCEGPLAAGGKPLQPSVTVQVGTTDRVQPSYRRARFRPPLVTTLLQRTPDNAGKTPRGNEGKSGGQGSTPGVRLLTVREVAKALRVCTATVYAMIERGELEHVRVSNSIRVVVQPTAQDSDDKP